MKFPDALYHYTVGPKLSLIADSGRLLPARVGAAPDSRERPVLWLSANRSWEPTATLLVGPGADAVLPTFEELRATLGAYRFRLDTRNPAALHNIGLKVLPWNRIPLAARIAEEDVARMTAAGLELGALPTDWWGCLEDVPLSLETTGMLRLDTMGSQGWEPVEGGLVSALARLTLPDVPPAAGTS